MKELAKETLTQVSGGSFFGIPTNAFWGAAVYVVGKYLFDTQPPTEEGLMTSAFLGIILLDETFM